MKKSLIVIKPVGVVFPEDCIQSCWDNHNAIVGALVYHKTALKFEIVEFEKLKDLQDWVKDINEDWMAILHFGGRYPVKDAAMPYFKQNTENDNFCYYFHSGDLDLVAYFSGNEDLELFKTFFEPISAEGIITLAETLAQDPKNGQFLLYTNIGEPIRQLGKGWEEVDGIIYSNPDHKKKVFSTNFAPSPPVYSSPKKEEERMAEEIDFFGLRLARPLEGISRYFKLPEGVIARVVSSNNPLFKPMDWILTIAGTTREWNDLTEFIRKKSARGGVKIHMRVLRIDQIKWSQPDKEGAAKELPLVYDSDPDPVLTDCQRNYIMVQLVNRMFKDQDETVKKTKRLKMANYTDAALIDQCETYEIEDWRRITS